MTEAIPSKLPPATIERWKAIVLKAARAGADISQLVQHFAAQSFQNKVVLLEGQGVHRRALTNMRQVLLREADRAEQASKGPTKKDGSLLRSYEASRFDFRPPTKEPAGVPDRKVSIKDVPMGFSGEEHGCTIVALKPALTTPEQLRRYSAQLHEQMAKIDVEIGTIDAVLNQGVRNHHAVVNDLAATSRELYALALEVVAELPPGVHASQVAAPLPAEPTATYAGEPPLGAASAAGPGTAQSASHDVAPEPGKPLAPPAAPSEAPAEAAKAALRNLWSRVTKKG